MAKAGLDLEKVVELIERSISPDSIVKQNVFLPVINSPSGRTRQCDLVIETGSDTRKSITIVEVQDRTTAVSIGNFTDWVGKLNEVGANSLICISRKEFPVSVKEAAMLNGNRVLLINLNKAEPEKIPFNFVSFVVGYKNLTIDDSEILKVRCCVQPGTLDLSSIKDFTFNFNEKIWSKDQATFFSLFDLITEFIEEQHSDTIGVTKGNLNISFETDERLRLYTNSFGCLIKVGLSIDVNYIYDNHLSPMTISTYEQLDYGPQAWVFEIEHSTSHGKIKVKIPVVKHEDENFKMLDVINSTEFENKYTITKIN